MTVEDPAVECYSGHTFAQEPRIVVWEGERYPVTSVERRWRTPEGPAFRVETELGGCFDLLYVEAGDRWRVQSNVEPEHGIRQ